MEDTGYSDTGDSANCEEKEIVSAAEMAGETGGVSCSHANFSNAGFLGLTVALAIIFRRFR